MWTDDTAPVDSDEFLRTLAAILGVPVTVGGHAKLLNNGDEWLEHMLPDFAAAQTSINFAAYMWEPGRLSDMVFDALIERARAGVEVRVLLDGLGGKSCPQDALERLEAAGGTVSVFRPLRIGKIDHYHLRNHRRAIVIDGRIGYTGGMAVTDHWLGNARNEREWRDNMTRVTGPLAQSLQSAFTELWAYVCGEVLTGPAFFPAELEVDSEIRALGLASSPASEEHPLQLLYFKTFMSARHRIWITSPYFVPDKHTHLVLRQRAQAGVDVRILVPNQHIDAKAVRWAAQASYQKLLDAGARIYEYQPTMIHSKSVVVDSIFSIVGSANMDVRSKELNEENVLGIVDRGFARELEAAFEKDIAQSIELDAEEWRHRGIGARALERVSGLFGEQY